MEFMRPCTRISHEPQGPSSEPDPAVRAAARRGSGNRLATKGRLPGDERLHAGDTDAEVSAAAVVTLLLGAAVDIRARYRPTPRCAMQSISTVASYGSRLTSMKVRAGRGSEKTRSNWRFDSSRSVTSVTK